MKNKKPTLGEKVKYLRVTLGLSQEEFAAESEISMSLLSKLETNKIESVKMKQILIQRWNASLNFIADDYSGPLDKNTPIFNGDVPELYKITKLSAFDPARDTLYLDLKSEIKFYRDLIIQITGGKTGNFLRTLNNKTALKPTGSGF